MNYPHFMEEYVRLLKDKSYEEIMGIEDIEFFFGDPFKGYDFPNNYTPDGLLDVNNLIDIDRILEDLFVVNRYIKIKKLRERKS